MSIRNAFISIATNKVDLELTINGFGKTNQELSRYLETIISSLVGNHITYDDIEKFFISEKSSKVFYVSTDEFIVIEKKMC